MKKIGEFLKAKRLEKGLSLRDVSKITKISHVHIRAIEEGTCSSTSFDKAIALLNTYYVSLQELERETGYTIVNNCSYPTNSFGAYKLTQEETEKVMAIFSEILLLCFSNKLNSQTGG